MSVNEIYWKRGLGILWGVLLFHLIGIGQSQHCSSLEKWNHRIEEAAQLRITFDYEASNGLLESLIYELSSSKHTDQAYLLATCYDILGNNHLENNRFELALICFEQEEFLSETLSSNDQGRSMAQSLNNLGNYYYLQGSICEASEYFNQALSNWNSLEVAYPLKIANALNNLGNCALAEESFDQAINYYQEALDLRKKHLPLDDLEVGASFYNLGNALFLKGALSESQGFFRKCQEIRSKKLPAFHPSNGRLLLAKAQLLEKMGDISEAKKVFDTASVILESAHQAAHLDLASLYNAKGNFFESTGAYQKANHYFEKAVEENELLFSSPKQLGISYNNLGNSLIHLGQYEAGIDAYSRALLELETTSFGDSTFLEAIYENLGVSHRLMGNYREALLYLDKALIIKLETVDEVTTDLANLYVSMGNVYLDLQNYKTADLHYKEAIAIHETLDLLEAPTLITPLNNWGISLFEQKNYHAAKSLFEKVFFLTIHQLGADAPVLSEYLVNLGKTNLQLKQYQEALANANQGIQIVQTATSTEIENPLQFIDLIGVKGMALAHTAAQNTDQLQEALKHFEWAIDRLESLKERIQNERSIQKLVESNYEIYEGALFTLYQLNQLGKSDSLKEKMLDLIESSKAVTLLTALKGQQMEGNIELSSQKQKVQNELLQLEYQQFKLTNLPPDEINEEELISLNQEIITTKSLLKESLIQDTTKANYQGNVPLRTLQHYLGTSGKNMLEYFVGDQYIYVLLITADEIQCFELPKDFPLDRWVINIRDAIYAFPAASSQIAKNYDEVFIHFAELIYQKIFLPFEDQFTTKELIIIPDGPLAYLPFDVLVKSKPDKPGRFKQYPFLIYDYQVSYAYSSSYLIQMQSQPDLGKKSFLGIAPEFEETNALGLRPLVYNSSETQRINQLLKGDLLLGTEATVDRFKEMALDYNIIHMATHGILNNERHDWSYVAMTPSHQEDQDQVLYVKDILNMRLKANLVVVSACDTGIGKYQRGEGILSVARGFSYAGAKSILTTLWNIDDHKTSFLMTFFYQYLKRGMGKDEALHRAKIDFLEQFTNEETHPYYWAPFVLIGDTGKLPISSPFPLKYGLIALFAFAGMLIYFLTFKQVKFIYGMDLWRK